MNYKELRIGNWVKICGDRFWQCNYVREERMRALECRPILLSPEIFKQIGSAEMIDDNNNRGVWKHSCGVWLSDVKGGGFITNGFRSGHKIYYLHQYQNIVFDLTGEELEIKTIV